VEKVFSPQESAARALARARLKPEHAGREDWEICEEEGIEWFGESDLMRL